MRDDFSIKLETTYEVAEALAKLAEMGYRTKREKTWNDKFLENYQDEDVYYIVCNYKIPLVLSFKGKQTKVHYDSLDDFLNDNSNH